MLHTVCRNLHTAGRMQSLSVRGPLQPMVYYYMHFCKVGGRLELLCILLMANQGYKSLPSGKEE